MLVASPKKNTTTTKKTKQKKIPHRRVYDVQGSESEFTCGKLLGLECDAQLLFKAAGSLTPGDTGSRSRWIVGGGSGGQRSQMSSLPTAELQLDARKSKRAAHM